MVQDRERATTPSAGIALHPPILTPGRNFGNRVHPYAGGACRKNIAMPLKTTLATQAWPERPSLNSLRDRALFAHFPMR